MRSCLVTRSFWVACSVFDSKARGDVLPAAPRSAFDSTDRSGFLAMTVAGAQFENLRVDPVNIRPVPGRRELKDIDPVLSGRIIFETDVPRA